LPETDLDLLIAAASESGRIATGFHGSSYETWDKEDGAGPVTAADLAVNRMLEVELMDARPDYGWLSEESAPRNDRQQAARVFIIDPIDGTRSFIEGSDTWAHSLAIAEKGQITAGVVYLPKRDLMYTAARGKGAFLNGEPIAPSTRNDLTGARVLATRPTFEPRHWKRVPDVLRNHRPSLAYRLALVAQGKFDAMFTLRATWEWDIAAGVILLEEAGATTSDKHGQPLGFNNADPRLPGMVGANSLLHTQITDALAR
jgi:myo-inositol-1(or 4)-monophosphatase